MSCIREGRDQLIKPSAIIFGCGNIGRLAYRKLCGFFSIVAWSDNNCDLWRHEIDGLPVIPPTALAQEAKRRKAIVFVCIMDNNDVCRQIMESGMDDAYAWKGGFFYSIIDNKPLKYSGISNDQYRDVGGNHDYLKILFVQNTPCIRTNKIAKALKGKGHTVSLAFTNSQPIHDDYLDVYKELIPINSVRELIDVANIGGYNVIHSSNEPDYLTALLSLSEVRLIHDCHDMGSAYRGMTPDEMMLEYLANTNSYGNIYTTEGIRESAIRKFGIPREKTFVLENLISEDLVPSKYHRKKSDDDGEIHCVYEGGIVAEDTQSHRYFEKIWRRIAEEGAHVHFYSNCSVDYAHYLESLHCRIHYEGNLSSKLLADELTRYDLGLCLQNINKQNRMYLEYASPNKIQEYVNASIPVAVDDLESTGTYVEKNCFGKRVKLDEPLYKQLDDVLKIPIPKGVLRKKGYTLESRIDDLVKFYMRVR